MSRRKRITGGMLSSANGNRGDEFQLLSRSSSSNIIPSSQSNNNSSNATESNNNSTSNSATTQEPKSPASSENVIPASSGSETNTNTTNGEVHNNDSSSKKTTELPQPESTLENQQSNPSSESITAMTYNITAQPLVEEDSDEDSWKQRRETIANTIVKASPDILAIQDASFSQVQDLEKLLSSSSVKYEWFGQGSIYYGLPIQKKEEEAEEEDEERDPRPNINHKDFSGEYVPIFYNSTKLKLLQCGTFWLSKDETLQGSRGWDSVAPRICTFCKFKDRRTKKAFLVFNTHFDQGRFARKNSCVLMRRKILELAIDPESDEILPAILLGDLNIAAASPLFAFLTTGQKPAAQTGKKGSPEETMEEMEYESEDEAADLQFAAANEVGTPTYTGFTSSLNSTVDYVLVTHETISVTKSSVLSDTRENGRQASTHRPVLAELVIQ